MKRERIRDDGTYNIIRTEGSAKTIFIPHIDGKTARTQLRHWKTMARNSGGKVYFSAQLIPPDVLASTGNSSARKLAA